MKVIFLDVDGVLNSHQFAASLRGPALNACDGAYVDPFAVHTLSLLVERTDAKLVLSSTWRLWFDKEPALRLALAWHGMTIWDQTPQMGSVPRGEEIAAWLRAHEGDVERYVILDDDDDMLPEQKGRLVQTDPEVGLTAMDAEHAVHLLNRKEQSA